MNEFQNQSSVEAAIERARQSGLAAEATAHRRRVSVAKRIGYTMATVGVLMALPAIPGAVADAGGAIADRIGEGRAFNPNADHEDVPGRVANNDQQVQDHDAEMRERQIQLQGQKDGGDQLPQGLTPPTDMPSQQGSSGDAPLMQPTKATPHFTG